jgi:peptidoglycan/LPS O-acetylase OafA/YrhL
MEHFSLQLAVRTVASHGKAAELAVYITSSMRPGIAALTSLRFFAAMVVVIFHYNLTRAIVPVPVTDFGYEAVTFFFVPSGFILAYAHGVPRAALNIGPKEFFAARLARICPAYYVGFLLVVLLFIAAGILARLAPLPAALVLAMAQSWIPQFALSLSPPAWSLSNEMFFYLLFPALWTTTRHVSHATSLVISAGLVLGAALVRNAIPTDDETWNNFRLYFPLLNLPQFILGMSIGYFFLVIRCSERVYAGFFLGGLAMLCLMVLAESRTGWIAESATLSTIFGSIIFGAAGMKGFMRTVLSAPPLILLGEASYGIYILHFPIWLWWNHYTRIVHQLGWSSGADFGAYLLLVVFASIAVLVFIERPARRAVRVKRPQ